MKTAFTWSFAGDLKKIKNETLREAVRAAVAQVEAATRPREVAELKKMAGSKKHFRIRVGDYRIGIPLEANGVTFVRCLPRRDLYRFFP
jgi:mRNA interferase RelE/StbE